MPPPVYFANPCTEQAREAMRSGLLGVVNTPAQGNRLDGIPMRIADNGCFGDGYLGDDEHVAWLAALDDQDRYWFATAPDVVGDAAATVARSAPFLPVIRDMGYRAAFVGQNGLTSAMVPWDSADVLFLGGSAECLPCGYVRPAADRRTRQCPLCRRPLREWKLGAAARELTAEALRRGLSVHMGRVNSLRRYRYAEAIGCTSVDGTYLAHGPDINLPKLLGWARDVHGQLTMFGGAA